jgi:hypothetical protein
VEEAAAPDDSRKLLARSDHDSNLKKLEIINRHWYEPNQEDQRQEDWPRNKSLAIGLRDSG